MAEEPRPGLIVGGRYELIEVAGRGGMADVWRGRVRGDWGFVRDVAVKQMHQNLAAQPPYVAMFVEEARLGSMLQSPNVAEVHDFVTGVPGSFDKTVRGIRYLRERDVAVTIKAVMMSVNQAELPDYPAFADSLGVAYRIDTGGLVPREA